MKSLTRLPIADQGKLRLRPRPLTTACWAIGLGGGMAAATALAAASAVTSRLPIRPAASIAVTNCDDSGPGSLRAAAADAVNNDTLDMTALTCSTITLTSGAIAVADTVAVNGPGAFELAIDGGNASRLFEHTGTGMLTIQNLTLTHGYYFADGDAHGGCIDSTGNVELFEVQASACSVVSENGSAAGGVAFAEGTFSTFFSSISGNSASSLMSGTHARGGGAAANLLSIKYSVIENNSATTAQGGSYGGGLCAYGTANISSTTISGNRADVAAGLMAGTDASQTARIVGSTISGNAASQSIGGARIASTLSVFNSTIAFNTEATPGGGLYALAGVTLQSTIIANNGGVDFGGGPNVTVSGANNLIMQTSLGVPSDTIALDPLLQPLADNGGPTHGELTLTHALGAGSPAIDAGNNTQNLQYDQRGHGYPRTVDAGTDIGAFEVQGPDGDEIFRDGFDP